jgi:hypothetical protein
VLENGLIAEEEGGWIQALIVVLSQTLHFPSIYAVCLQKMENQEKIPP